MCILPSFSGITSSFGKIGCVSALCTTFPGRALLKTQAFLLEIRINILVWDLWSICVCFSLVRVSAIYLYFFFFQNSEVSDGKLSGDCSVLFSPSGNAARSPHRTETTSTSSLQRGAEPLQGHTWLPARSQGEPRLPLDTGLAPWLLPWFYQSLLICHLYLSLLSWGQQSGQLPSAWAKLRRCSLQSPTAQQHVAGDTIMHVPLLSNGSQGLGLLPNGLDFTKDGEQPLCLFHSSCLQCLPKGIFFQHQGLVIR